MSQRQITIRARLDQVESLSNLVGECAESAGFDATTSYACQLAVSEACENIILHGYGPSKEGEIEAAVDARPGYLCIRIRDDAQPFNPAERPEDQAWPDDEPPVGGLGLLMIHRLMDKISYTRRGGRNLLTLVKSVMRR
jgi:anti-sigma regulatory factor (Ser/Thr protein kinase)